MSIRILIADDHAVVREGLRMFPSADKELEVIAEAASGAKAMRQSGPDVVLMDLLMLGSVECRSPQFLGDTLCISAAAVKFQRPRV